MKRKHVLLVALVVLLTVSATTTLTLAQGPTGTGQASAPGAPAGLGSRLTYQGRLTNSSGAPLNSALNMVFKLYDDSSVLWWTSATRSVTPVNGLFTVYLGDGSDPDLYLYHAASIGVTVGSDPEMTPRQPLNTVYGHSNNAIGVLGDSNSGQGVIGSSNSSIGVHGSSDSYVGVYGSSNSGDGVVGTTGTMTRAGVLAQAAGNSGIALEISRGGIKATGAGVGANTFAFIHVSSVENSFVSFTRIDNALTNGDQNAMLFVTHVYNPSGVLLNNFNLAFGVYYDSSSSKWTIDREDGAAMPAGTTFNVMVIKR